MIGTYRSTGSNVGSKIRQVASARTRMRAQKGIMDYAQKQSIERTKLGEEERRETQIVKRKGQQSVIRERGAEERKTLAAQQKLAAERGKQQRAGYRQYYRSHKKLHKEKLELDLAHQQKVADLSKKIAETPKKKGEKF